MSHSKKIFWTLLSTSTLSMSCGTDFAESSKPHIVGGQLVQISDQGPERVSTVALSGCTGTIIAEDLILTAAHCFNNSMRAGFVVFGTQFYAQGRTVIKIAQGLSNPAYKSPIDSHIDVAMLKLEKPIPEGYQAIQLLPATIALNSGDSVRLAGYGSNNEPNSFGTLRVVDSRVASTNKSGSLYIKYGKTAACSGDSGGPLYVYKNYQWYLAGITSTAVVDSDRNCSGGNYYSSIDYNRNLIMSMARQLSGRENPFVNVEAQTFYE